MEDVHGEALLVKPLHNYRAELHLIVEPRIPAFRLVQSNESMVSDQTNPQADSLSRKAPSFSDYLHLGRILLLVKHENKHTGFMLKTQVLIAETHWTLLQETVCLLELDAFV